MRESQLQAIVIYFAPQGREYNHTFKRLIEVFDELEEFSTVKLNYADETIAQSDLSALVAAADVIYLHYSLLYQRVRPDRLRFFSKLEALADSQAVKVAMPQDEGNFPGVLDDLLVAWGVQILVSVHFSEQGCLYPMLRKSATIINVLPAFLNLDWIKHPHAIKSLKARPKFLSYRGRDALWRHGKANLYKSEYALKLSDFLTNKGLVTDVSINHRDRLYGDQWSALIQESRAVYGAPGGYTALDFYGELSKEVVSIIAKFKPSSFADFDQLMAPGWDSYELLTLTARHFEAAYYGTPQVLLNADYKGLLKPYEHYIPLSKDLSNLEEVYELLLDEEYAVTTIENFRRDLFDEKHSFAHLQNRLVKLIYDQRSTSQADPQSIDKLHAEARLAVMGNEDSISIDVPLKKILALKLRQKYGGKPIARIVRPIFFGVKKLLRLSIQKTRRGYYLARRVVILFAKKVLRRS